MRDLEDVRESPYLERNKDKKGIIIIADFWKSIQKVDSRMKHRGKNNACLEICTSSATIS